MANNLSISIDILLQGVDQIKDFRKEIDNLTRSLSRLGSQDLALKSAKEFQRIAEDIGDADDAVKDLSKSLTKLTIDADIAKTSLAGAFRTATKEAQILSKTIDDLSISAAKPIDITIKTTKGGGISTVLSEFGNIVGGISGLLAINNALAARSQNTGKEIDLLSRISRKASDAFSVLTSATRGFLDVVNKEGQSQALVKFGNKLENLQLNLSKQRVSPIEVGQGKPDIPDLASLDTILTGLRRQADSLVNLEGKARGASQAFDEQANSARRAVAIPIVSAPSLDALDQMIAGLRAQAGGFDNATKNARKAADAIRDAGSATSEAQSKTAKAVADESALDRRLADIKAQLTKEAAKVRAELQVGAEQQQTAEKASLASNLGRIAQLVGERRELRDTKAEALNFIAVLEKLKTARDNAFSFTIRQKATVSPVVAEITKPQPTPIEQTSANTVRNIRELGTTLGALKQATSGIGKVVEAGRTVIQQAATTKVEQVFFSAEDLIRKADESVRRVTDAPKLLAAIKRANEEIVNFSLRQEAESARRKLQFRLNTIQKAASEEAQAEREVDQKRALARNVAVRETARREAFNEARIRLEAQQQAATAFLQKTQAVLNPPVAAKPTGVREKFRSFIVEQEALEQERQKISEKAQAAARLREVAALKNATDALQSGVKGKIRKFLEDETGSFDVSKIVSGLQRIRDSFRNLFFGSGKQIADSLKDIDEKANAAVKPALGKIQQAFTGLFGANALKQATAVSNTLGTAFNAAAQQFKAFVNATAQGNGVIGSLARGLQSVIGAVENGGTSFERFKSALLITGVAVGGLILGFEALKIGIELVVAVAESAVNGLLAIARAGIEANSKAEQIRIGIASVLASVAKIKDSKGVELKGLDALTAVLPVASEQLEKLAVDALETALTFDELAPAFLQAIGAGTRAGLGLDEIRKTVIAVSQVIIPLTGNARQLGQELRALFSGDIGPDAQVALAIFGQNAKKDIELAKQQNRLAEFFNEKLAVAAATGKLIGKTFEAARSNLKEAGTLLAKIVTKDLFDQLRDKINTVIPQIFSTAGKKVTIAAPFAGIADTLSLIFRFAGDRIGQLIDIAISGLKKVSGALEENRVQVALILAGLDLLARTIFRVGSFIANTFGVTAVGVLELFTNEIFKAVLFFAGLKDIVELVFAGVTNDFKRLGEGFKSTKNAIQELGALEVEVLRLGKKGDQDQKGFFGSIIPPTNQQKKPKEDTLGRSIIDKKKDLNEEFLRLDQAFAIADAAIAKANRDAQLAGLEDELEDRKIALEDFFRAKAQLLRDDSVRELNAIQVRIDAEKKKIDEIDKRTKAAQQTSTKDARKLEENRLVGEIEKVKVRQRLTELETEKQNILNKSEQEDLKNDKEKIKSLRELQKEIDSISGQLLRASGEELGAALKEIDLQFAETLAKAQANARQFPEFLQNVLDLINKVKTEARAKLTGDTRIDDAQLAFSQAQVQAQATQGVIGEIEARERLTAIQRAYAETVLPKLQAKIDALKSVKTAESETEILKLEQQKIQIQEASISPIFKEIRDALNTDLKGSILSFLNDFGKGIDSLRNLALGFVNAFRKAINTILADTINKAIIQPIVNAFLTKVLGFSIGDPITAANTVATDLNTAALNANTAALTGETTTNAVSGGVAGPTDVLGRSTTGGDEGDELTNPLRNIFDKISGAIKSFANGIANVAGKIGSGLRSVLSKILDFFGQFLGGLLGGGAGGTGGVGPIESFAEGGATAGAVGDIAGVVHGGEFVQPASVVRQWGPGFFEAIRSGQIQPGQVLTGILANIAGMPVRPLRQSGFASGGLAGSLVAGESGGSAGGQSIRIINVVNPNIMQDFLESAQNDQIILNRISRQPGKFRAALGL